MFKEDSYPVDTRGKPDLRYYRDGLEYYIEMYERHLDTLRGRTGHGYEPELSFKRRVNGQWGLIANGAASIPYALALLKCSEPEGREDGAAILSELGRDDIVVEALLRSLETEIDVTTRDTVVLALGRMRNRTAIPHLARIIRNELEDGDTRWTAVEGLGLIVRRRFLKQKDPLKAALAWLEAHSL